jgi:GAF domain-containing protein
MAQWRLVLEEAREANDELRTARDQLELQVRRRTNELQQSFDLTSQVGFMVAQSNSLPILLQRAIELIQNNFNFYHVHIYTYKPGSQELVMARGSGDVGRKLLEIGHTIEYGKGMVGTAARYKQVVLENNVDRDPNFIRNPLLPDTQSEMAIPLLVGDTVLGVLDIQENRWSAFNEATQKLMQNLANQLAVAIRNFRLVEESTAALERIENLNRRLTRENWSRTLESTAVSGYAYAPDQTYPTTSDWLPSMRRILAQNTQDPPPNPSDTAQTDGPRSNDFAIPLILRGEILGVLGLERPLDVPWTEDDELVIQNLAEQITLALESARLLEDTQRNAWRDQVVSETTAQVWSSADVQDVLRSAVAQLADKLDASEVVIRLGTEKDLTSST